jgi:hypothetical protein
MFGKNPRITPLEARKRLLIAESEINRFQMGRECEAMMDGVRSLAHQVRSIRALASSAASLIAGLVSSRRRKSASAAGKPSWWQTFLQAAQLAGSLWTEFH